MANSTFVQMLMKTTGRSWAEVMQVVTYGEPSYSEAHRRLRVRHGS